MREEARLPLFPSPTTIFSGVLAPAEREAARAWLLAEQQRHPGIVRSNIGGWHSLPDLIQRPAPALQPLWAALVQAVTRHHSALSPPEAEASRQQLSLQAWAMIMAQGDYTSPHDHPDATWAGVYCLDAGDASPQHPTSGSLTLHSPLGGRHQVPGIPELQPTVTIPSRDDQLVLFPGWLLHHVHPYQGQRARITIAFNAQLRTPPPPPAVSRTQP